MKLKLPALVFSLAFLLSTPLLAQKATISKLEIAKGETYVVEDGNLLLVDTLIMHDKATIAFDPALYGVLEAKAVYIGKKCTITSKGKDGENGIRDEHGADGTDGGNLTLTLHFVELEELTIDARGGDGGKGANGKNGQRGREGTRPKVITKNVKHIAYDPGTPGTAGGNATDGGSSGNGGNVMLVYSTTGFVPVFNSMRDHHNINILYAAGKSGFVGKPGTGGHVSHDGVVIRKKQKLAYDGRISLTNITLEAAQ